MLCLVVFTVKCELEVEVGFTASFRELVASEAAMSADRAATVILLS